MADHFRWIDQEFALVSQGESIVLYLPCPVLVPITVMSYEVIYGMHEKWKGAASASTLRMVKDTSPGCEVSIRADKVVSEVSVSESRVYLWPLPKFGVVSNATLVAVLLSAAACQFNWKR